MTQAANKGISGRYAAMQAGITHRRMIESYAFAITRDFHLSEDVAQEVALLLLDEARNYPQGDGFILWLKEVIRRKSLEALRRRGRMPKLLSPEAMSQVEAVMPELAEDDAAETMSACLDQLAGDARKAIVARYGENLPVSAIAERLGRTVQGAYALLKRVRQQLEACMEQARRLEGMH